LQPSKLDRALKEATKPLACFFNGCRLAGLEPVEGPYPHAHAAPRDGPAPGTANAAADGDDVREDASEREQRRFERTIAMDRRRSIAIGDGVLVEIGQQVRDAGHLAVRAGLGIEPVLLAVDDPVVERPAGEPDA